MSLTKESKAQAKLKEVLTELLKVPENKLCAECNQKQPRWASANLGIFICIRCSGLHRNLGVHISKVRSVTLDSWTSEMVEVMKEIGNERANSYWEFSLPEGRKPGANDSTRDVEMFIRDKYQYKRFVKKGEAVPTVATATKSTKKSSSSSSPKPSSSSSPKPSSSSSSAKTTRSTSKKHKAKSTRKKKKKSKSKKKKHESSDDESSSSSSSSDSDNEKPKKEVKAKGKPVENREDSPTAAVSQPKKEKAKEKEEEKDTAEPMSPASVASTDEVDLLSWDGGSTSQPKNKNNNVNNNSNDILNMINDTNNSGSSSPPPASIPASKTNVWRLNNLPNNLPPNGYQGFGQQIPYPGQMPYSNPMGYPPQSGVQPGGFPVQHPTLPNLARPSNPFPSNDPFVGVTNRGNSGFGTSNNNANRGPNNSTPSTSNRPTGTAAFETLNW